MPATKTKKGSKKKGSKPLSKKQRIEQTLKDVNTRLGYDAVQFANDPRYEITRIPTGILSIDYLLHGGMPRGRHVEIYGTANVGKTYLTLCLIAMAQSMGLTCAFFDAEKTFDNKFARKVGVNIKDLVIHRQKLGPELIDMAETFLYTGEFDVIVIDSIAALLPKEEYEKGMEAGSMGAEQAKMMSKAMRKLTSANKNTVIVYINQMRDKIGVIFGVNETTSGGRAMSFYSGLRLQLSRNEQIKRKGDVLNIQTGELVNKDVVKGHRVLARVEKNKTGGANNYDQATFVFDYERGGHDPIEDLIFIGRDLGWIHKKGDTWWVERFEKKKVKYRSRFYKLLATDTKLRETLTEWITTLDYDDEGEDEDE